MRKPFKFTVLSDIECSHAGCRKKIKANLVARKQSPVKLCYKHHREVERVRRDNKDAR